MFFIALTIVLILAAVAFATSGKSTSQNVRNAMPQFMVQSEPQAPVDRRSLRQQQRDEEAAAIADEYTARADAEWRKELRAKAAAMLDPAP